MRRELPITNRSHAFRVTIPDQLLSHLGSWTLCETLANAVGISGQAVWKHLQQLLDTGEIERTKAGRRRRTRGRKRFAYRRMVIR